MELENVRLTPNEKAIELRNKVMESQGSCRFYPTDRKSAILIVDEIIENLSTIFVLDNLNKEIIYWNEVRSILMNINQTLTKIT